MTDYERKLLAAGYVREERHGVTCYVRPLAPVVPMATVIRGPWRERESRWRIALEILCALLVLLGLGAFFGAAIGWLE